MAIDAAVDADAPLVQAGVPSTVAVRLSLRLSTLTRLPLSPTLIFEHPTPRAIASHLAVAGPSEFTKLESIIHAIQEELIRRRGDTSRAVTLPKSSLNVAVGVPIDAQLPSSSLQHQLLLHQQLQPESAAYNMPVSFALKCALTEPMARAALQALVRRHAVLRTYYTLDVHAAAFYQVVLSEDGYSVPLACCVARNVWSDRLDDEMRAPLDLCVTPPIRAILLQADPSRLVIKVHHVAADMDAIAIMCAELATHCSALALHRLPPMPARIEFEYADFAVWEHARRHDDDAALSWWMWQLQGAPEIIDLPRDWSRPDVQATASNHLPMHLGRGLTACVVALCASAHATLNSTLLAMWGALLLHLSGQLDVVIGLPHSMRYVFSYSHTPLSPSTSRLFNPIACAQAL